LPKFQITSSGLFQIFFGFRTPAGRHPSLAVSLLALSGVCPESIAQSSLGIFSTNQRKFTSKLAEAI
jgi:hypothetical protein